MGVKNNISVYTGTTDLIEMLADCKPTVIVLKCSTVRCWAVSKLL